MKEAAADRGCYAFPELDLIVGFRAPGNARLDKPRLNQFFRDILASLVAGGRRIAKPVVNAGADQTITLPTAASLEGNVTDAGQPGPLMTLWHLINGPGTVAFDNPNALVTKAVFSEPGRYVVRLTGHQRRLDRERRRNGGC